MDPEVVQARQAYFKARDALDAAVRRACPGAHRAVQHRDRQPPWCAACGRDNWGFQRKEMSDA